MAVLLCAPDDLRRLGTSLDVLQAPENAPLLSLLCTLPSLLALFFEIGAVAGPGAHPIAVTRTRCTSGAQRRIGAAP